MQLYCSDYHYRLVWGIYKLNFTLQSCYYVKRFVFFIELVLIDSLMIVRLANCESGIADPVLYTRQGTLLI